LLLAVDYPKLVTGCCLRKPCPLINCGIAVDLPPQPYLEFTAGLYHTIHSSAPNDNKDVASLSGLSPIQLCAASRLTGQQASKRSRIAPLGPLGPLWRTCGPRGRTLCEVAFCFWSSLLPSHGSKPFGLLSWNFNGRSTVGRLCGGDMPPGELHMNSFTNLFHSIHAMYLAKLRRSSLCLCPCPSAAPTPPAPPQAKASCRPDQAQAPRHPPPTAPTCQQ